MRDLNEWRVGCVSRERECGASDRLASVASVRRLETQLHWPGLGTHYLTLTTTQEISAETREKAPGDKEQVLSK